MNILKWLIDSQERNRKKMILFLKSIEQQSKETRNKQMESMKGKNKGKHRVYHEDGTYHYGK